MFCFELTYIIIVTRRQWQPTRTAFALALDCCRRSVLDLHHSPTSRSCLAFQPISSINILFRTGTSTMKSLISAILEICLLLVLLVLACDLALSIAALLERLYFGCLILGVLLSMRIAFGNEDAWIVLRCVCGLCRPRSRSWILVDT